MLFCGTGHFLQSMHVVEARMFYESTYVRMRNPAKA